MKPPKTERESPPADPSPGPPSLIPRSARARVPRPRRSAAAGPMPSRARQQRGLQLWVSAGPVAAAKPRQEKRTVRVSSSPWGGGGDAAARHPGDRHSPCPALRRRPRGAQVRQLGRGGEGLGPGWCSGGQCSITGLRPARAMAQTPAPRGALSGSPSLKQPKVGLAARAPTS